MSLLKIYFKLANVDGFQKFKIMVVRLDLTMEKDEKLASYLLSMNQNFLLFPGKCSVDQFKSNFFLVTPRARVVRFIR